MIKKVCVSLELRHVKLIESLPGLTFSSKLRCLIDAYICLRNTQKEFGDDIVKLQLGKSEDWEPEQLDIFEE